MEQLTLLNQFIKRHIWDVDCSQMPRWRARLIGMLRVIYLIFRDLIFDSQLTLQAMSLVYTTLLALVPLIAVSVSVLKGFGVHNEIELALSGLLQPLGDRGVDITKTITNFVNNINSGLLGSLGLALLLYTVISLMQKIEEAFNHAWQVREERSFTQRFSDYLSVILIGPVLIFSAIGLTASITNTTLYQNMIDVPGISFLITQFSHALPMILVILAFTFVYMFMPNTHVKFTSALVGATVAGIVWQTVGWLFTWFVSSANYTLIYSAFAALFFFMIWLYVSWTILLIGASIAFYHQHPDKRLYERRSYVLSNRMKERLALVVMAEVARRFYLRQSPPTLSELALRINIAHESIFPLAEALIHKGMLIRTADEPPRLAPGQAPEHMTVLSIIEAVRQAEEDDLLNLKRLPQDGYVDGYFAAYQDAAAKTLAGVTLKDLVGELSQASTAPVKAIS